MIPAHLFFMDLNNLFIGVKVKDGFGAVLEYRGNDFTRGKYMFAFAYLSMPDKLYWFNKDGEIESGSFVNLTPGIKKIIEFL